MKFLYMTDIQVKENTKHIAFDILDQIYNLIAKDKSISAFIFGGDLLEVKKNIDISMYNTLYRKLHNISQLTEMYLLKGNHDEDYIEGNNCLESMFPFANVVSNGFIKFEHKNSVLYFVPFGKQDNMVEWFQLAKQERESFNESGKHHILFGHCYYDGFPVNAYKNLSSRLKLEHISPNSYDLCLFGDIHTYGNPFSNFYFPGTPYQRDFNDSGKTKYIFVVECDQEISIERVILNYPKFLEIKSKSDFNIYKNQIPNGFVKNSLPELREQIESLNPERIYNTITSLREQNVELHENKEDLLNFKDLIFKSLKSHGVEQHFDYLDQNYDLSFSGKNNIVIKGFEADNFLSYKKLSFKELIDNELVSVVGRNFDKKDTNDKYGSNGSGKSSVFEAIVFALFGRTIRNTKVDYVVNDQVKKNCRVKICFSSNNKDYIIERYRKHDEHKNSVIFTDVKKFESGSQDGQKVGDIRILQKEIDEIIGFNFEQFVSTTFLSKNFKPFFGITGSKRKEIFWNLLGLNCLDEVADNISKKYSEANSKRQIVERELGNLKFKIETNLDVVKQLSETIEQNKIKLNENVKAKKESLLQRNDKLNAEKGKILDSLLKINEYLNKVSLKKGKFRDKIDQLEKEEYSLSKKQTNLSDKSKHSICPFCEREINNGLLEKFKQERIKIEDSKQNICKIKKQIEPSLEAIREKEQLAKDKKEELNKRAKDIGYEILSNIRTIDEFEENNSDSNSLLNLIEQKNIENSEIRKEIDKQMNILSQNEKEYEELKFWNDAFKQNIISDYISQKVFKHFEKFLNKYLDGKYSCAIEFIGKLKQPELTLHKGKTLKHYDNFSEGEKGEVDIASILSLFAILRILYGGSNILLIDDLFYQFDKISTRNCIELLRSFSIENQISVYIISQRDEVISLTDKSIVIEMRNGISEIKGK